MKFPPAATKASSKAKDCSLFMLPMNWFQLSPMDIPPSCRGDTRIPALGESTRYRPRGVAGSGGALKISSILVVAWWFVDDVVDDGR